jgi:DNA-binding LacI/PurR family transcriptional regulator
MINSGYSQLIFFWKNESTDENMHKRRKGFLRAVEDHWRGDKDNCRECDILESEKLYNYINSLSGERKLGVFCVADHVALQLLASIDKSLIPECVGVMAYDNIILGGAISPSLSTIDPHAKDVGQRAVDLLLAQVEEDADVPVKGTTIKADLILRDSVLS